MSINPYQYQDYRSLVKARVRDLRAKNSRYSLRYFAQRIPVQYTYLSKVLSDAKAKSNLNEDHLHTLGTLLNFSEEEIDFLLLLRSRDLATRRGHRDFLTKKIEGIVSERSISASYKKSKIDLNNEISYLLNPYAVITHMALDIEEIRKNPICLSSYLGISRELLIQILFLLEKNSFIEIGESPFEIKSVSSQKIHFGREHPLMRTHQALQRTSHEARLMTTSEQDKESFNATFTMDESGLVESKKLIKKFVSEMQKIAGNSRSRNVYQLSLSLLKWF